MLNDQTLFIYALFYYLLSTACQCQAGGERGGHCHCPWDKRPAGVDCRSGGNHWICFPNIFG